MKKVLSLVLTLSLVLGTFSMAFAVSFSDVAGEDYEDAVSVLIELGVVSGYDDGTYKPENIVTRAEMAVLVVRALGYDNVTTGTSTFTDMDGYSWAQPYISMAQGLGVISGYGDGTFRPGNTVSYDEAATMLVAALGYTAEALNGTWPANFVDRARVLGIMDGVSTGGAGANRGDIATMVYQTLDQQIGKVNKDGDFVTTEDQSKKSDTMLDRLGAEVVNPDSDGAAQPFVVTKDIVDDAAININKYLGAYVTAYQNDDEEIIAITEEKSTFLTGEFDDADGSTTVGGLSTFTTTDDVEYDIRAIGDLTEYFKNGDDTTGFDIKEDTQYTIAVDISGKKIDAIYSVAQWEISADKIVDADELAAIEEDQELLGNELPLDDSDEIDASALLLNGVASLDDIKADNVVYIYTNAEGIISRVDVGTEVITGKITRKTSSTTDTKVTIGGETYQFASQQLAELDEAIGYNDTAVDSGSEGTFTLDYFGYIYDADADGGDGGNYAVFLKGGRSSSNLSDDYQVRLFTADGNDVVFNIDTDDVTDYANWMNEETTSYGAIVEYSVNADGNIDYLEAVNDSSAVNSNEEKELRANGTWNGYNVNSDAILFTYDPDDTETASDPDAYGVTTVEKATGSEFKALQVALDSDQNNIVAIVIDGLGDTDDDVYGVLIEKFKESESTTDYAATVLVDGKDDVVDIGKGVYENASEKVLYKFTYDSNGAVSSVTAAGSVSDVTTAGSVSDVTTAGSITVTASAFSSNYITVDGERANVRGAQAYMWNADDECFEDATLSKGNIVGNYVALYDVVDEDSVYDIVLIVEAADAESYGLSNFNL